MNIKKFVVFAVFLLIPNLLFSQVGKLRGKVTDKETGDPIAGVNILIEGSDRSISTDLDGDYILIGLPPGTYSVQAEYVGYQRLVCSNVRILSNLTTTLDIQLKPTTIEMETSQIIAERPLIQRNAASTIRLMTQDDIQNLPIRGLQNIISLNAGTVVQDGILHIRGGRPGEVFYYIDGVTATNPLFNTESIGVIQEAIEDVRMQPSGYTAELGGGNSGAVRTTLRTGGDQFKATIDYRTDDFVKTGNQFLGTTSFGYRNGVITLSGPVPVVPNLKFFVAGQYHFMGNDNPTFIKPFRFDGLVEDAYTTWSQDGVRTEGDLLPNNGVVEFKRNHLPGNSTKNNIIQGTLVYDVSKNIKLHYSGSYSFLEKQTWADNFYEALKNYYALGRQALWEEKTNMNSLRLTHMLSPKTFYELSVFHTSQQSRRYDPVFGDNWRAYTDSAANFEKDYGKILNRDTGKYESTYRSRWRGPYDYSVIYNFNFLAEDSPVKSYDKYDFNNLGFSGSFHTQLNKNWELIAGGRYDSWLLRRFSVGYIPQLMGVDQGWRGKTPNPYDQSEYGFDYERNVRLQKAGDVTLYGYDIDGNEVNSGVYGPNNPVFVSAFLQNKFEYNNLLLNIGLRFERVDIKALKPKNQENPEMDIYLDWLKEDAVTRTEAHNYFLPRLSISLPVSKNTVCYASYGKFIQMPQLDEIYRGYRLLSQTVSPATRHPYGYWSNYVGYTAKPEETIQYEIGINQALSDNISFTATGFYKDMHNLLRMDRIYSQRGGDLPKGEALFSGYLNNDFAISKGLELTLDFRRTKRLAARVHYTFSTSRGTGSTMFSNIVVTSDAGWMLYQDEFGNYYRRGRFNLETGTYERIYYYGTNIVKYPSLAYPLNYNQTHRGSIMLDYRFAKGEGGKILEGLGCNLLLAFDSGHAYTQVVPPQYMGCRSAWGGGISVLADERNRHPVEPINSSSTPWFFNVDLQLDKMFYFNRFNVKLYTIVLNLLNTKNILNVYETTGTTGGDGWYRSASSESFLAIPRFEQFYETINLNNGWSYMGATGKNLWGPPRQIRFGVMLEIK